MVGKVFPAVGLQTAGGRILPSPSEFYLTGEDRLRVVSCNALVGVSLKVQWRTVNTNGDVVPNSEDHTPNSDRTVKTQDYELGTGSLLNVTVFANAAAPLNGQTYVMVQLVRGFGAAAIVLGTLLGGYVTRTQALGFPGSPIQSSIEGGGAIRTILGTVPVPGNSISEVVPAGARWEVFGITAVLTTGLGATPRSVYLVYISSGGALAYSSQSTTVGASSGYTFAWGQGLVPRDAATIAVCTSDLVQALILLAGQTFQITATNLVANDQFSAPFFTVRERLEVG